MTLVMANNSAVANGTSGNGNDFSFSLIRHLFLVFQPDHRQNRPHSWCDTSPIPLLIAQLRSQTAHEGPVTTNGQAASCSAILPEYPGQVTFLTVLPNRQQEGSRFWFEQKKSRLA